MNVAASFRKWLKFATFFCSSCFAPAEMFAPGKPLPRVVKLVLKVLRSDESFASFASIPSNGGLRMSGMSVSRIVFALLISASTVLCKPPAAPEIDASAFWKLWTSTRNASMLLRASVTNLGTRSSLSASLPGSTPPTPPMILKRSMHPKIFGESPAKKVSGLKSPWAILLSPPLAASPATGPIRRDSPEIFMFGVTSAPDLSPLPEKLRSIVLMNSPKSWPLLLTASLRPCLR